MIDIFDFASFLQVLKFYTCIEVNEVFDTNEADIVPRTAFYEKINALARN